MSFDTPRLDPDRVVDHHGAACHGPEASGRDLVEQDGRPRQFLGLHVGRDRLQIHRRNESVGHGAIGRANRADDRGHDISRQGPDVDGRPCRSICPRIVDETGAALEHEGGSRAIGPKRESAILEREVSLERRPHRVGLDLRSRLRAQEKQVHGLRAAVPLQQAQRDEDCERRVLIVADRKLESWCAVGDGSGHQIQRQVCSVLPAVKRVRRQVGDVPASNRHPLARCAANRRRQIGTEVRRVCDRAADTVCVVKLPETIVHSIYDRAHRPLAGLVGDDAIEYEGWRNRVGGLGQTGVNDQLIDEAFADIGRGGDGQVGSAQPFERQPVEASRDRRTGEQRAREGGNGDRQ